MAIFPKSWSNPVLGPQVPIYQPAPKKPKQTTQPTTSSAQNVLNKASSANALFSLLGKSQPISTPKPIAIPKPVPVATSKPQQVMGAGPIATPAIPTVAFDPKSELDAFNAQFLTKQQPTNEVQPVRPITPAPTMLKDTTTKPMTDDELQMSVIKKSLKQQYGDSLTDDEANFIAKQQIAATKQPTNYLTEFEAAQKAQLEKLTGITQQQQADYEKKKAELEATNQKVMEQFKAMQEAQATEGIAQAEKYGAETEAVQERLLGSKGNLTSTVGTQAIGAIKAQTNNTINAINAAKNAAIQLKQAELEGASAEQLKSLSQNLVATKQAEAAAILEAENALQNAKLQAVQAGDEAKLNLLQSALDQLSVDKVKSKADATLTKNIGDGFVYDEFGQRITDAEGNFITYESPEELQDFITLKEGDTLIDPKTGLPVYQSPKTEKAEFQKIGDDTYQVVDGQLQPIQKPVDVQAQAKAITQAKQKISLIDEILNNPKLDAVVGIKGPSTLLPGGAKVKNKINQLIGDLVLDERGKLKGSGAISDFETKIIKQSATALGTNLSNEDFREVLNDIKQKFANVETTAYLSEAVGISQDEAAQLLEEIKSQQGAYPTFEEIKQTYPSGFNSDLGTSQNYQSTDVSKIKDGAKVSTIIGSGVATGIQGGSSLWDKGLDLVLSGGKAFGYGAPVKAPFSGTVVDAGNKKGWGNQVKIKLNNGEEVWISHLAGINVKPGQKISAGMVIGAQGNTGSVLGGDGRKLTQKEIAEGRGTHLDITMKKPNGKYYTSKEVASLLGTKLA